MENQPYKRLMRASHNKVIGGVCSGLGRYFNIDPVVVRVIFAIVFLLYGFGLIAYLIMWLIIPEDNRLER
ncbi:MAG: PspC domain-containing protein [Bacteroidales bacterium]|nr:PspC domain-containing protein [Bacteroidales bacterium]